MAQVQVQSEHISFLSNVIIFFTQNIDSPKSSFTFISISSQFSLFFFLHQEFPPKPCPKNDSKISQISKSTLNHPDPFQNPHIPSVEPNLS
ncbi:TPA: hypothetical protein DEG21_03150 [Patescibacteria group bacterium]|nr:hypothetical protein [Candidatus Gracilibacteria bacterium]HBY74859.1 hypothetical protein [Candidatus Gracilibacteria bacterium]